MEILIRNAKFIITMDAKGRVLKGGSIVIRDGKIEAVDKDEEVIRRWGKNFEEVIDASGMIAMPGLIQSHVHLIQTAFRGLAEDLPLLEWLKARILPLETALTPSEVYYSSLLGCIELLKSGTTAVFDFGSLKHLEMVFKAMYDSGIRGVSGKILMDKGDELCQGAVEGYEEGIREGLRVKEKWCKGRLGFAFSPRFALSCTEECLREVAHVAKEHGVRIHTHAAESLEEVEEVKKRSGLRNIEYLNRLGLTGENVVIAHCIWIDDVEMGILARTRTNVVHCPSTNLKLGSGVAKVPLMLKRGINVAIGADGAPCNNSLDVFWEIRLASLLQKGLNLDPKVMPAKEAIKMATLNGARAMGLESSIGCLEVGRRADVILIKLDKAHLFPFTELHDPYSLIYSLKGSDVAYTIVDGKIVVREGTIVTVDEEKVVKEINKIALRLIEQTG